MTAVPERLRTVRTIYRHRGDGKTALDITYAIYVGLLLVLFVAFPLIRAIALSLAQPQFLLIWANPNAGRLVSLMSGLLLAGLLALGATRGPALLTPLFTALLAGNDLPRNRTLRRPFTVSASLLTTLLIAAAALIAAVLFFTERASLTKSVGFVAAAACFGVLASVVWLIGQVLGRKSVNISMILLATTALTYAFPILGDVVPWGWIGLTWPVATTVNPWALVSLVIMSGTAVYGVPRLLNMLNGRSLMDQSMRWEAAGASALAGDTGNALATFRAQPHWGRKYKAVRHDSTPVRFFIRDFLGSIRIPYRFVTGAMFLLIGNFVMTLEPTVNGAPGWLLGGVGAGVAYLAIGVFSDGFRHVSEAASAPPLYGYSTSRLYSLHALQPIVWTFIFGGAGIGLAAISDAPLNAIGAAVSILMIVVRIYDSAKGPLPPELLTPMPTQLGDMSTLVVLTWQADALLISLAIGAIAVSLSTSGMNLSVIIFLTTVPLVVLSMTRRRLRMM